MQRPFPKFERTHHFHQGYLDGPQSAGVDSWGRYVDRLFKKWPGHGLRFFKNRNHFQLPILQKGLN